jgi:cyclophilin family peptidyl-prolyl cis-trans isomerase
VGYAVFGKVIEGMDVVDRIAEVDTTPDDVPRQDVIIKSVRRVETK